MDANEPLTTRQIDMESLKALAHPLRIQILDTLSTYGQFTASGLADRLGESSGATSYHLRQLERHGFVREVTGKGTARERWWERTPGRIDLPAREMQGSASGRAASSLVLRQWNQNRQLLLDAFTEHSLTLLPASWTDAAAISTINLRLTAEQLAEFTQAFEAFSLPFIEKFRGQESPGARPVQVQFNAFPVIDGTESAILDGESPNESAGGAQ